MRERSRQARNHPIPTDETQRKFDTMVCGLSKNQEMLHTTAATP